MNKTVFLVLVTSEDGYIEEFDFASSKKTLQRKIDNLTADIDMYNGFTFSTYKVDVPDEGLVDTGSYIEDNMDSIFAHETPLSSFDLSAS